MWRVAYTSMRARSRRLALTVIAVLLGVTFVTGTLVLTDTSTRMFDQQFRDAAAGVDLVVRGQAAFDSAMGVEVEREALDEALVARLRRIDGVADAEPLVQGQALLARPDGETIVPPGPSVGSSWTPPPLGAFAIREGRAPAAGDEVVVDVATATTHGFGVGDRVTVRADGEASTFTVVGLAGFGDRDGLPDATIALFDLPTAQQVFDLPGQVTQIMVSAEESVTVSTLLERVAATVGPGYDVATGQDLAAASAEAAKAQMGILRGMLLVIAATALLVGAFMIGNTFSITVAQRTREFAVLRAVGATGRQITASVLSEALAIGLAASAAGALLGVAAAVGLRGLAGAFGVELPDGALVVAPGTLAVGMIIGTAVTLLSALGPARRAARVAPVQAMRDAVVADRPVSRRRHITGAVAAGLGSAVMTGATVGVLPSLVAVGAAGLLVIVGLASLAPAYAGRLAAFVGAPLSRLGVAGRLARGSASRVPRRTAATMTALAIGLAVVTFMTVLASSIKESVTGAFDDVIRAEYIIESARGEMLGGLSPHVAHRVGELDEVAAVSRMRFGHWKDRGATEALTAIDPATLPQLADLDMVAGDVDALSDGGVVLSENVARTRGVGISDDVVMTFARSGEQRLEVVGILSQDDQWATRTGYVMSLETYARHFTEDIDASVLVGIADGVAPVQAEAAITAALKEFPTADLRDQAEAKQARTRTIDEILGLVSVLLLLAVGIALLGITNTLALSIVERTREIGLLRATGMTGRQVRSMVRSEALLVAVLGALLGVILGLAFGWVAVCALSGQAAAVFRVPAAQLLASLVVAGLAGLAAGMLPARRAARLDVLAAVAAE